MSICTLNGAPREIGSNLKTWGQLLDALEQGEGAAHTIVTGVRFAGVEQPTFRDPAAIEADLTAIGPIELEVSTKGELLAFARRAAANSLEALAHSARHVADAFRLHDLPRAHRGLADFVTTFQLLTALTAEIQECMEPPSDGDREVMDRLNVSLGTLVDYDVNEDWISVADVLEYEIADLLPLWSSVIGLDGEAGENCAVAADVAVA